MEEELKPQFENEAKTQVATETQTESDTRLDSLPRAEDLIKSEKEVKIENKIAGLTDAKNQSITENRTFATKKDEKKVFIKKRLKVITGVYIAVATLLLAFVGINVATMAVLNKEINTNTQTIQMENYLISNEEEVAEPADPETAPIQITLNEPRDYSDDKKELTFFDKITILFRNLFG